MASVGSKTFDLYHGSAHSALARVVAVVLR